jgi:hypothetical protein
MFLSDQNNIGGCTSLVSVRNALQRCYYIFFELGLAFRCDELFVDLQEYVNECLLIFFHLEILVFPQLIYEVFFTIFCHFSSSMAIKDRKE